MTLINIDLRNVAGETGRHDQVVFHAPVHREGSAGQTIQTAPVIVDLEGGIGSVDLDPGPVVVEIRARGWEDTAPKTVMVPEEGPITLTGLLLDAFEWAPVVVSEVRALASRAEDAAVRAETAVQEGADQAVSDAVEGLDLMERTTAEGLIEAGRWVRPGLAMDTDLNSVKAPGVHPMNTYGVASSATNRPTVSGSVNPGFVEVHVSQHRDGLLRQVWVTTPEAASSASPFRAERWFQGVVNGVEQWTPWKSDADAVDEAMLSKADITYVDQKDQALGKRITDEKWDRPPLNNGEDLNEITDPGVYPIIGYTPASLLKNRPTQQWATNPATLTVTNSGHRDVLVKQVWETTPEDVDVTPVVRVERRREADGTWTPWQVDPLQIYVDQGLWIRPDLTVGEDLNEVTYPGLYRMIGYSIAASLINRPQEVNPGYLMVLPSGHRDGMVKQVWQTTPETASSGKPITMVRYKTGPQAWSEWEIGDAKTLLDQRAWARPGLVTGTDLNSVTVAGTYPILSWTVANSLPNRPPSFAAVNPATLTVLNPGHKNGVLKQVWETMPEAESSSPAVKMVRYKTGSTTWTGWEEEKSGSGDVSPLEITVVDAPPGGLTDKVNELQVKVDAYTAPTITKLADTHVGSGMKVVPLSITLGTGNGVTEAASGSWRMPVLWNAPILRWRLCVTTRNPRFGNTPGNDVVLRRVTWGQHSGNAAFSSAPAMIAENFTVPGNGDIVRMPWQNTPITEGQEHLLAFDWASSDLVQANMGSGWLVTNEADAVSPGTVSRKIASPLDWWIEAETYATTPTVAVLGDSISSGHSADTVGPVGSWLGIYMRQKRGLPVHYSAGGEKARDWWKYDDYKRTRWADLSKADACIFALGYNDAADGADPQTFEQHVANVMECLPIVREYISQNLYGVTITPSVNLDAGREAERVKMNDWMRSERSIFRDIFDFEQAVIDPATGGLLTEYASGDKTHLSSAGYEQLAATITLPVTTPPVVSHSHPEYATTAQVEARTPEIRIVSSPDLATSPGVLYVVMEG